MTSPNALEPPWWRPPKGRGRRQRPPLSRDAIVDAALAILDADGVDALTIRRLGQELGTGAASLYWHIAGITSWPVTTTRVRRPDDTEGVRPAQGFASG